MALDVSSEGGESFGHRDASLLGLTRKNLLKSPHEGEKTVLPSGSWKINTAQGNRGDGCVNANRESAASFCPEFV